MHFRNYTTRPGRDWSERAATEPGADPVISQDRMLELTANASVDGVTFDGIDLFLSLPHTDLGHPPTTISRQLADKVGSKGLVIGSLVAPIWGGGGAFGTEEDRKNYLTALTQVLRHRQEAERYRHPQVRHHSH